MRRVANGVRNYIRAAALSNGGNVTTIAQQVAVILAKYGTDAHVYLPGIGVINGLTAGNYLDSAGTTAATVDNPVGLVVDSGGINAIQATTANKPILRRGVVNLLTYSEQFDNAAWTVSEVTVIPNATVSPDGATTADKLISSAVSATHSLNRTYTVISGLGYTLSIYVKKGEYSKVGIREGLTSGNYSTFNLTTGAVISTSGYTATIEEAENGFYRIIVSASIAGTSYGIRIIPLPDSYVSGTPAIVYTGDGTSGIYIWGAQLETGSTASTYIPTTTAPASSPTGNYHWVHDSTDVLTATFPAGYESATTINASTAGQSTLTAQNIVGAYNIGPSIDTYGRFVFRTGLTASELAIVQQYCNRLAGV